MLLLDKLNYYDYFITSVIAEMKGLNINEITNDEFKRIVFDIKLHNLKISGLLFLCIAVDIEYNKTDNLMTSVFDNLRVVPYGIMDEDIRSNKNLLKNYVIPNCADILTSDEFDLSIYKSLDSKIKNKIYNSILLLKGKNENILNLSPYDITEIVRKFTMYKIIFTEAIRKKTYNEPFLPSHMFIKDMKISYE